jgi:predicted transporter
MTVLAALLTRIAVAMAVVAFPLFLAAFIEMSSQPEAWSHWTRAGIAAYWFVLAALVVWSLAPDPPKSD